MGLKSRALPTESVFRQVHRAHGYGAVKQRPRQPDVARTAIRRLSDIDSRSGDENNTVLHQVVTYGSREEQSDATWNKGNQSSAAIADRRRLGRDLVTLILAQGATVDAVNQFGQTALHLAASGDPVIVKLLLDAGASPNLADCHGFTPLMHACMNKAVRNKSLKLLLAMGADATATVNSRTAATMLPAKHKDLAALLGTKKAKASSVNSPAAMARAGDLDALYAIADNDPSGDNDRQAYKWLCAASDYDHKGAADLADDLYPSLD